MIIYKNLIANTEEALQVELDHAAALGWGSPSNPTITHWEERMYDTQGKVAGKNDYTQWTQVVSKEIDDG